MARVTVEDCIVQIPNRFELVMLAAQRARNVSAGSPLTVGRDRDKNPVVALREIADRTLDLNELEDALIQSQQKYVARDEADEDVPEFDALEGEMEASAQMTAEARSATSPDAQAGEADAEQAADAGGEPSESVQDESDQEVSLDAMREEEAEADVAESSEEKDS